MNEDSIRYAYIEFHKNFPDETTKAKISSLIKSLNGSIYFIKTACESYGFLMFNNPIPKSNIISQLLSYQVDESQLFPIMSPILDEEALSSPLYITNLPDGNKNSDLESLLKIFDSDASVCDIIPNIFVLIEPTKANLLLIFLPYIKFKNETKVNVTIDRFQIPVIKVSNLPNNFRKKEFSLFRCPYKIINCEFEAEAEEQEQVSKTAYLSFSTNEEANKAIEYFNFAQIDLSEISAIHYIYKNYKILKEWEISVKNISPESKGFDLWHRFKEYGPLLAVDLIKNFNSGAAFGIVQFYKKENAERAIQDISKQKTTIVADFTNNFIVSVYNIDPSLTRQDIGQCFKQVSNVEINQAKRGMLGSAQITFLRTEAANACINSHHIYNGVRWIIRRGFQNKAQKDEIKQLYNDYLRTNTIIIKNLQKEVQLQTLIESCAHFGIIRYLYIQSDTANVSFEEEKSAKDAAEILRTKGINGNPLTVEFMQHI